LIPDLYIDTLLGDFHLHFNRGMAWQIPVGMANRIGKPFNHRQLALQQDLTGQGSSRELVEPGEHLPQG
jgi:hypothetical protein